MRPVALEEHFSLPSLVSRIDPALIRKRGFRPPDQVPAPHDKLKDLGAERLEDMDAAGITVQVLSWSGPGADLLPGEEGISFARDANDALARTISGHPDRYARFAHLPMQSPGGCGRRTGARRAHVGTPRRAGERTDRGPLPGPSEFRGAAGARRGARRADLTSIPTSRPRRCARRTSWGCPSRRPTLPSPSPAGAGIRRRPSTSCVWCSTAPWKNTPSSRSSRLIHHLDASGPDLRIPPASGGRPAADRPVMR